MDLQKPSNSNRKPQTTVKHNRTISPSELTAGRLKFGFTSYNNNNSSPYADFLHMRSYTELAEHSNHMWYHI